LSLEILVPIGFLFWREKGDFVSEIRHIFGTDGVRGRANEYPMTAELALSLGRAAAYVLKNGSQNRKILIGKDTRLSCYMLEEAMVAGVCSMGVQAYVIGPMPTPGIAFLTQSMRADAGVVISASHNPYYDNGIKFFDHNGFKLPDEIENRIEQIIFSGEIAHLRPTGPEIGRAKRIEDAQGRYTQFLKTIFPKNLRLDGLKIVVDCAHGAAYKIAPLVFEELGADVIALGVKPNGLNINDQCGALHPENMCQAVLDHGAHLGLSLDGDADRVVVCDERGEILDGDVIMAICAKNFMEQGKLAKKTVVGTVMSNLGLEEVLRGMGAQLVRAPVGDRYVIAEMHQGGYNFGGEQSGHLIYLDHTTTGDGTLAALQVLEVMVKKGKRLSELKTIFQHYPQILVNIKVQKKIPFSEISPVAKKTREIEKKLGDEGRLVLRYSGTENLARIMIEGREKSMIEGMAEDLAHTIEQNLS